MKKIFLLLIAALLCNTAAWSQTPAFRQGSDGYSLPRTVLTARITQEQETILRGPYARYAAQYLGITGAAMSDKVSYRLVSAELGYYQEPDPTQIMSVDEKSVSKIFEWINTNPNLNAPLSVDPLVDYSIPFKDVGLSTFAGELGASGTIEKSTEQMAADAASVIFKIRKRRIELITGEQGENVFGAGLKAALAEMDRIENMYIELFMGKTVKRMITKTYSALPEIGKNRLTVCRFSETKGIVAESDLSGRPLTFEIAIEKSSTPKVDPAAGSKKSVARVISYRIPAVAQIRLLDGTEVLSQERIPIFQLGSFTEAPVL